MTARRPRLAATAAVALGLLLTGCGGEGGPAATHHRTEVAASSPTAASSSSTASATGTAATTGGAAVTTSAGAATSTPSAGSSSAARSAAPAGTSTGRGTSASGQPGARTVDDGSRTLRIPVLGVDAPVTGCATEDNTVTPPSDIGAVCRWTGSPDFGATRGTTIVVGHSTRSDATVGALEYVRELKTGDTLTVAGQAWRVVEVVPGVDKHSLPAWIVDRAGPRQLGLVTCETTSRTRNDLARLVPVG
ncbi:MULTISPECIES: class F sortase [Arsenicicoccus]|uniref:Class F sortase n=1 Tax=Arsenicicoccus bolidensis TaxID=229480 RepID=A0ABS9Q7F1_9MICO|nr:MULTISPECIES: class F sortase [Arsenicicoccus]MCG7323807.1 class F sortase [Arsenicicoccus bolidensis]